jgi:very-long-chain (3R)-3-hydroxyacyl-CoA dehydratase
MLLAWSPTEVIRYSYFTFMLSGTGVPAVVSWLRYSTFYVLYPIGISSECWLMYKSLDQAEDEFGAWYKWTLIAIMVLYVPCKWFFRFHA